MVITPTRIEASHAVMRRAASMNRRAISGTRETNTLSHTCPVGSRICSNIAIFLSLAMCRSRNTQIGRTRLKARLTLPEFRNYSVRLKRAGQSNITTRLQVNREIRCWAKSRFHSIFIFHLRGVPRFDKDIQAFMQFVQRYAKCFPESRQKKLL